MTTPTRIGQVSLDEYATAAVAAAPSLTDEQVQRMRGLLARSRANGKHEDRTASCVRRAA